MERRRPALDLISHSPEQTRQFGAHLGRMLRAGDLVLLAGQIGAGKTTLVQGIARGLGIEGYVQSPTFTLAAEYDGRTGDGRAVRLYHLDLYRLEDAAEFETFGYEEYLTEPDGITIIEWPDRLPEPLVEDFLVIQIAYIADTKRRLAFFPRGTRYDDLVTAFRTEVFGARQRSAPPGD